MAESTTLAVRILACLCEADDAGLPLVALHLDAALVALRGSGAWPSGYDDTDSADDGPAV